MQLGGPGSHFYGTGRSATTGSTVVVSPSEGSESSGLAVIFREGSFLERKLFVGVIRKHCLVDVQAQTGLGGQGECNR